MRRSANKDGSPLGRRLGGLFAALIVAWLGLPAVAQANPISISGSMEGSLKIANGHYVAAGYSFTIPGNHLTTHVLFDNATVTISGSCSNGGTDSITIPLAPGPWTSPINSSNWYPSNDQASPLSFQGSVLVQNVCGGTGLLDAGGGATFTADVQADVLIAKVSVRFHYRDPAGEGKANVDCSAGVYPSDVCGASWSGTKALLPDAINPGITLAKAERVGSTGSFTHGPVTGRPGDTVHYQMTVTNTGNTSLVLDFADQQCDAGTLSGPVPALTGNSLPAGASAQYTCSHVLVTGDIPGYTNTASVTGTAGDGSTVNASDSVLANIPAIGLTKLERIGSSGSFTGGPVSGKSGDTVEYQMTVSNPGGTPLVLAFTDPQCDAGTLSGPTVITGSYDGATRTLSAGGVVRYTCSHVLAVADAPMYTNTASVTGTAPDNSQVSASDSVDATVRLIPAITVTKLERIGSSGSFTHGPVTGQPGDTVQYQITVTNTGQTSLALALTDQHCDTGTLAGPVPALTGNTLPVGGSVQYTCSHVLAVGDAPTYTNTAAVTGTAPDNSQVHASDSVDAHITLTPAITLTKLERIGISGLFTDGPVTGLPGDTVQYQMTVTNTGQTPLVLTFTDAQCDAGTLAGPEPVLPADTLAVGGSVQYTCSHVLAVGDAPTYTNTASVTGTAPDNTQVHASDSVDAQVTLTPEIALTKLERIGSTGSFTHGPLTGDRGDIIEYQMTVDNTGGTPLVLAFTDDQCDSGTLSGPTVISGSYDGATRTLSAGGSIQYTCSHQLNVGDNPYTNTASVIGTAPNNSQVSASDSVDAYTRTAAPGIALTKLQRIGSSGSFTHAPVTGNSGDTVEYQMSIENTGGTDLVLVFTDPQCDAGTLAGPTLISGSYDGATRTLSAGGALLYTCSHLLAAGNAPAYTNTAFVTGTAPDDTHVQGSDSVIANVKLTPAITLVKQARLGSSGSYTGGPVAGKPGDTVEYRVTVANTGELPLILAFTDPGCDAGTLSGPVVLSGSYDGATMTLSAGGSIQYTCSHVLAVGDAPTYTNTASVTGTAPDGSQVSASDSVDAHVTLTPAITLTKLERIGSSGSFTAGPVTGQPGDTVEYQMTVTNTGQTPLVLNFSDQRCDAGTLAGPVPALTGNSLPVGASVQYTCSHLLAVVDAPTYTNTASVTGTAPDGSTVTASGSVDADVTLTPAITLTKQERIGSTSSYTAGPITGQPGDAVEYRMTIINTGQTPLALAFTDDQCDSGTLSGPIVLTGSYDSTTSTLSVGGSVRYTCSHVLTVGDAPTYTNTASVTGTAPDGSTVTDSDSAEADVHLTPAIGLVKLERIGSGGGGGAGPYTGGPVTGDVGDTVDYQMTVTNTGQTPLVLAFTDPQCDGGTLTGPVPALTANTLPVRASVQYTCSHVLAAGESPYTNTASVTGTAPDNTQVHASANVDAYARAQTPAISLTKLERIGAGAYTSGPITGNPGDTVEYQMTVTNTGQTSLVLAFTDPQCDPGTLSPPTVLAGTYDGATKTLSTGGSIQYTCTHSLTAADAPTYTNTASVTGTAPDGQEVSDSDSVVASVKLTPAIGLVKEERIGSSGSFTGGPVTGQPGDTVQYRMTVANTGETPLELDFSDPRCDAGTLSGPIVITGSYDSATRTLSAGGSVRYTCSHVLAVGDAPTFTNTASVAGTAPDNSKVSASDSVDVDVDLTPAIELTKLERIGSSGPFTGGPVTGLPGDTVNYEMTVANTGQTPLVLAFTDPQCDAGTLSGPIVISGSYDTATNTLAAGASVQYTCSHVLAVADAPTYTNTASVTGTAPDSSQVHASDSVDAHVTLTPAITLTKLERLGSSGSYTHGPVTGQPGDSVNYQITVTNTGQTPLVLSFTDQQCDAGTLSGPVPVLTGNTLPAGGSVQYTCSHVLAVAEAPTYTNTASVTGTAPDNSQVHASDSVDAHVTLTPAITLTKLERIGPSGAFTAGPVTGQPGDTVNYQMTVANTGQTPLVLAFTDPQCDAGTLSGPIVISGSYDGGTKTLSSGGAVQYTCSHLLATGDSPYTNTAIAVGTAPDGARVRASDSVDAYAESPTPGIALTKLERIGFGSYTSGPVTGNPGDTVQYQMTIDNTGGSSLVLSFSDPQCDAGTLSGPIVISGSYDSATNTLSAGGSVQYTCSHLLAAGDAPTYTNTASVTGTAPDNSQVHASDSVDANVTLTPAVALIKEERIGSVGSFTGGPVSGKPGDTVNYQMTVTNTGDTSLVLNFSDPQCDAGTLSGPIVLTGSYDSTTRTLSLGGSVQYTCSHLLTAADAPTYTNTASVTGTAPGGSTVSASDSVDANVTLTPAITLTKEERIGSSGSFTGGPVTGKPGDTVEYRMTVTNTGQTPLVLSFTDPQCDAGTLSGPIVISGSYDTATNTLAAGGSVRYTCSHVLAAGDAPTYTNTAAVVGTAPDGTNVHGSDSVDANVTLTPAITLTKDERLGSSGSFTGGPITGNPGDTVNYRMTVTNTGQTPLALAFTDDQCDSGTLSGPIVLTGSYDSATGTVSVGGSVRYTCSHVLVAGDSPTYTNNASVTGTGPDNSQVNASDSVDANVTLTPAITLTKDERIGSSGSYTGGPVIGNPGNKVEYRMTLTNTGETPLVLAFTDPQCDAGTLSGPVPALTANTLPVGASVQYTCSHVLAAGESPYTNTASVTGTAPDNSQVHASDSVDAYARAQRPAIALTKLERIGAGAYTSGPITGNPGDTVEYQMTVINTGQTSLVLAFTDAQCDSGTLSGPVPALTANTLPTGKSVQYTCTHILTTADAPTYTNTASVTGTAPDGTKVHDSDSVDANVRLTPDIGLVKEERIGSSGSFTGGPITGKPGDTVNYQITVINTGQTPLVLAFSDPQCDAGTLSGPIVISGSYDSATQTLSAGGSVRYTCSHVLAVGDAPTYTNTASVTGTAPDGTKVGASDSVDANLKLTPAITLVKQQRVGSSGPFTGGPVTGRPGDTVNYQITVTNTGQTPLVLAFTDPQCDAGTLFGPIVLTGSYDNATSSLSAGGSVQYTCSHVLAVGDAPTYANTASVTGTAPDGSQVSASDTVDANITLTPAITLTKLERIGSSGSYTGGPVTGQPGDTVNYQTTVTNTGQTPLVLAFTDQQCDAGTLSGPVPALTANTLPAGGSVQYTCSHVLASGDAPAYTNTASVIGTAPDNSQVHASDSVDANVKLTPAIALTKLERIGSSGSFTGGPITGQPGDTVQYQMTVANTGQTPLVLAFTDPQCDAGTLSPPSVLAGSYDSATNTLSAGGAIRYTCSHVLAAGDSPYTNTATVVGTAPDGGKVRASDSVDAYAETQAPRIALTKRERIGSSGSFTGGPVSGDPGDTVQYQMTIDNTGNTTLMVAFTDPGCDAGTLSGPIVISGSYDSATNTLSVGGSIQYTCSHLLAAADAPTYTNTASVTGTAPDNSQVHASDSADANVMLTPAVTLTKEARIGSVGSFTGGPVSGKPGDTVNYQMTVTNTGDTSLVLDFTDPQCDAGTLSGPIVLTGSYDSTTRTLSLGGSVQYTCSHLLTAADAPTYTNTASVTGTAPGGSTVSASDSVDANVTLTPAITLTKEERIGAGAYTSGPITGNPGDTVEYRMTVINTGQTPLTLVFTDPQCDAGTLSGPIVISGSYDAATATLSPGGSVRYTCSHVLGAGDAPTYTNTAVVVGTAPDNSKVSASDSVDANVTLISSITLTKEERLGPTGPFTGGPITGNPGDTVNYRITVTNTGQTPLTLVLTDQQCDTGTLSPPTVLTGSYDSATNTLSPSGAVRYTCSHVLAIGDAPTYTNTASVSGTAPDGSMVNASDSVDTNVTLTPAITLTKEERIGPSGSFTHGPITGNAGDTVQYRMTVTNSGQTPLEIAFADPGCDAGTLSGPTPALTGNILAVGNSVAYTCSHLLAVGETPYANTATVIGTAPDATKVHATDSVDAYAQSQSPGGAGVALIKLERIGSSGSFTAGPLTGSPGDTVEYRMAVTNTGLTPLKVDFTDPGCDPGTLTGPTVTAGSYDSATRTLSAGGVLGYTCVHVLATGDTPTYTNTATVTGTTPAGNKVHSSHSVKTEVKTLTAGLRVVKLQRARSAGPYSSQRIRARVGDTIEYKIEVTNTGQAALTLSLSDPLCDRGSVVGPVLASGTLTGRTLSAGGSAYYLCKHVLRLSDPKNLTNTATVTGQTPTGATTQKSSSVTATRKAVVRPTHVCRALRGKLIRYTGHRKPRACRHLSRRAKHPRGFTG